MANRTKAMLKAGELELLLSGYRDEDEGGPEPMKVFLAMAAAADQQRT